MSKSVKDTNQYLVERLRVWMRRNGRSLPWRKTREPYLVWVSEVMLQQTQVVRVVNFYNRFVHRFPTVEALATARWNQLLPYWRGLGYYHRARAMLETARTVIREHGGRFPRSEAELRALPGIGKYTASALRSMCFGEREAALDTNLLRVLARYWACPVSAVPSRAADLFQTASISSRALNFALMDLGALVCVARSPRCPACPLLDGCYSGSRRLFAALEGGSSHGPRPKTSAIDVGVACIHMEGKYLIAKRTRAKGGNWEFPGGKREDGESVRSCIKREIQEEIGVEVAVRPPFHIEESEAGGQTWRLHFCRCQILRGKPRAKEHEALRWLSPEEILTTPFPKTNRRAVERLAKFRSTS